MYNIYKLTSIELSLVGDTIPANSWYKVSGHSQSGDAEVQLQRFIDSGILIENLKIVSDDSDPNAPTQEPQP